FDGLLFTPIASWMGSIIHFDFYAVYHNYFQNYLNGFNYTSGLTNNPASFNNVLAYGKQITAPVVLYQLITVKEISNGSYKSPVYQKKYYQVYTNDLITRVEQSSAVSSNSKARTIFINDKTSRVGNVLSEQNYDKNTDKFLSGSNYTYSNTFDIPNNQGIIGQVSHEHRIFHKGALNEYHYAIVAVNVVYPSVLLSKADVGASHCITNNAINNAFDFYSGDVTELVSTDANGSTFKSQTIPAYVKYPGMGVKVVAAGNKNMLVPTTAGYKIKVDTVHYNSHIDTLTSSISTWSNTWSKRFLKNSTYYVDTVDVGVNIWRQNEVWFWNSPNLNTDGSYKKFTPYAYGSGSQATGWQKQGFIYRYSPFSQKLETKDLNVNSVSTKQGYNQAFTLTAGSNCKYTEIAFSGAEDLNTIADLTYFGGEVSKGGGTQTKAAAHTGKYGLSIAQNNTGFIYRAPIDTNNIERGKPYRASVWINNNGNTNAGIYYKFTNQSGVQLSGTSTTRVTLTGNTNVTTCGNWKLITIDIKVPSTVAQNNLLEVGCDNQSATIAYFDDIRFYPLDQPIVTYVYDPNTKWRTYVLDADNFYTRTQYDNAGRVVAIYRETINGEILRMTKQYNFPH
ncbi:MAG: hypothetical protein ACTHJT_09130, partial [Cytophaga sp.]|uniref:hypothetical protein n=1 Tax=Cytophaga sp. TaxID=29535 RepID=UPI003F7FD8F1